MQRDYKNRIPAFREQAPRSKNPRVLLLAGVLIFSALALAGYLLINQKKSAPPLTVISTPIVSASVVSTPVVSAQLNPMPSPALPIRKEVIVAATPTLKQEPRFTFYKILSEHEVIMGDNEVKTIKREEQNSKTPPKVARYFIQVGSFINQQDAEILKSSIVELKIPAKLEMIQVDNSTWFRVKVGPYATLTDVEKVRHYLRSHRVDSVVQRSNH
ncbi:MAG: SPOR domain-containing protein [Methylococcaceae bacterium]